MIIYNLQIPGTNTVQHIRIVNGMIVSAVKDRNLLASGSGELCIDAGYMTVFPGLINSHDHLDFNLFPALRGETYSNYMHWGRDIQTLFKDNINAVLKVPKALRIQWGQYKNLLNGITTVVQHGESLQVDNAIIRVFSQPRSLHSVGLEKNWKRIINWPHKKHQAFVIHIGEGTDAAAYREIDQLTQWNLFGKKIVGVHGVAMDERQASHFQALVWCPASNFFLLNKTAAIDRLKWRTKILFGTDSTLSASWNIWEHLRMAREQQLVSDEELFDMLTTVPAGVWGLKKSGHIAVNQEADLVIAKPRRSSQGWDAFYGLNPEDILLVLYKGNIRLIAQKVYEQHREYISLGGFSKISLHGHDKYVWGDLPGLMAEIRKYYPDAFFPVSEV